uniref:Uncharacterized protein n=1 Tax=Plectus sambesii TaxID=2011161 RepID=A0A914UT10_9BILA
APDGEPQPSTDVDLFISTEKIMVLNTDLQVAECENVVGMSALAAQCSC